MLVWIWFQILLEFRIWNWRRLGIFLMGFYKHFLFLSLRICGWCKQELQHILWGLPCFVVLFLVFFALHLPFETWLRCIWCMVTARTKFTLWMQQAYKFLYSNWSKPSPSGCQTSKNFDLTGLLLIYAGSLKGRNSLASSFFFLFF